MNSFTTITYTLCVDAMLCVSKLCTDDRSSKISVVVSIAIVAFSTTVFWSVVWADVDGVCGHWIGPMAVWPLPAISLVFGAPVPIAFTRLQLGFW